MQPWHIVLKYSKYISSSKEPKNTPKPTPKPTIKPKPTQKPTPKPTQKPVEEEQEDKPSETGCKPGYWGEFCKNSKYLNLCSVVLAV